MVTVAAERNRRNAPAAEWLLDNFYLIADQIRTARRHLPSSYSQQLPRLANGAAANFPRIYGIALDLISHVDGQVDSVSLDAFIASYQNIHPLTIGELWAVPIVLRLTLIENLRRVATQISESRRDRDLAADWADRMVRTVEKRPSDLIVVMADMSRANPPLTGAFLAEMTRHLQGQSPHFAFARNWLAQHLAEQGQTIDLLVLADGQAQAANHVSMGNSIVSLRYLSSNDWRDFFEKHSLVERILREDLIYPAMTFTTRDSYRHVVEEIARQCPLSELDVADEAIRLARQSRDEAIAAGDVEDGAAESRSTHVGFYLLERGRAILENRVRARLSTVSKAVRLFGKLPLSTYLFSVICIAAILAATFFTGAVRANASLFALMVVAVPLGFCLVQLGLNLVNWLALLVVSPRALPQLEFREAIPPEHHTVVVVPTLLTNLEAIADLIDGLEIRYLANRDNHLSFALLTDLLDAPQEVMPGDDALIDRARTGIEHLNQKYEDHRPDIFAILHRPRLWNASEGVWMGHERKRGKLGDFNALLRKGPDSSEQPFSVIVADVATLSRARYVITLDTDTQLPRDAARRMIGAMAHPLNRPVIDPKCRRVIDGYGIMQPRVGVSLPTARCSWFVRLFAGDAGVDPYTRVVSDVYQDLFGEGSFVGKGIYDIDAFEQTCHDFPENAILSHDLLESTHARSGLLSDVELYEEFPTRYLADVSRRQRWMRGDWQIAAWLSPRSPEVKDESSRRTRISALSRWKILDNLRRSVTPIAMTLALILGWLLFEPVLALWISLLVLAVIVATPILAALFDLTRKPVDLPLRTHAAVVGDGLVKQLTQAICTISFLPFEASISADAIIRTLARVLWTRSRLLEWRTSSEANLSGGLTLMGFQRTMAIAPAIGIAVGLLLALTQPVQLLIAGPWLVLWIVAPTLAWWLSRDLVEPIARLSHSQRLFLHKLARKTWRYFEVLAAEDDHWLPPDNYQEPPLAVATLDAAETSFQPEGIASRTSPTNIGVALLSDLAAYDFGFCSIHRLLARVEKVFGSMAQLERHRGHFFNWYGTRSLKPLLPLYVSSVDSGNLAGHLLVLRAGLLELIEAQPSRQRVLNGLRDTASVLLDVANGHHLPKSEFRTPRVSIEVLHKIHRFIDDLESCGKSSSSFASDLERCMITSKEIAASVAGEGQLGWWSEALAAACGEQREDLVDLAAWMALPPPRSLLRYPEWREVQAMLDSSPSLRTVVDLPRSAASRLDNLSKVVDSNEALWLQRLRVAITASATRASERIATIERLAGQCREFADMDFSFLFDEARGLFAIGCNVSDGRLDKSFYDLLASEFRLTSYAMIAQGQVDQEHWFALGRTLTATGGATMLLSWSGSMFEYLMPLLVMPTYRGTLLDQTCRASVRRQIAYGKQRGVPWGISESGYNAVDAHATYQYRAFGVPGLGLKRGLAEDLVIAPYASALGFMVEPEAACANLERLSAEGREGEFGLYEAIDYTPSRLPRGTNSVAVRQFMAHHEGMTLLSLAYGLLDQPMQRRFTSDPALYAADLLLQERVPKAVAPIFPHVAEANATQIVSNDDDGVHRVYSDPAGPVPEAHLLSNGTYHVAITNAGGGYSRWRDLAVTRWREDATRDNYGAFCYLRDLDSGRLWSSAWQPTQTACKRYQAIFTQSRAEFRRSDDRIDTHTEISVSPEDDVELRRITITNRSKFARTIEVTSYAEIVLAPRAQDVSHPAFSNLFVTTEIVPDRQAILATRRPRSAEEKPPWMMHLMTVRGTTVGEPSFETDRMRFIGRGRTVAHPVSLEGRSPLSGSQGPVLDPVVCIRRVVVIQSRESARIDIITGVGESREITTALIEKYSDPRLADRVFELAWTHSQILLRQLDASVSQAQEYSRLAGSILFATSLLRAKPEVLAKNRSGQSGLWGYGISGDLPIVLVRIRDRDKVELVRQAIQAHAYWRMKGLAVDMVIWNEDESVYRQSIQETILGIVGASPEANLLDKPGGIFVRRGEQMSEEDRTLLQTVARVILVDDAGSLHEQIARRGLAEVFVAPLRPVRRRAEPAVAKMPERDLAFFNGLGGFSRDGREYVMLLAAGQATPAPWVNVIANDQFGTVVSEGGGAYTWAENSHEFRLTPWLNDPVTDACGEALYIRDEENGAFWSPSPRPAPSASPYVARHGFGYSMFEHTEDGIVTELSIYVAIDAPVKFVRLKLSNQSGRHRSLSATRFCELVLGETREKSLMHVTTELDANSGAVLVRNRYNPEFADRIAFFDCSEAQRSITGDRTEFLGRNGSPANPAALSRIRLSGRLGSGFDPCVAMQCPIPLEQGQEKEIIFLLGAAHNIDDARSLVQRFRSPASAYAALENVWHYWSHTLGVLHVETPDPAVNFLANGWLLYQTLACRMWARTGFYQSGGAFGFRDQLQDAMALVHAEPGLLRRHLLLASSRQFEEGDVQHWWHPPMGRGVRTHFSDDYLWLPYATCHYVAATGDTGVLDERTPFLRSRLLHADEEANYELPHISEEVGTLYEHCLRSINNGLRWGVHDLPLMGCGDWNDGMNLVGQHGQGESVWLAFFLYDVLRKFIELAASRGDTSCVAKLAIEAEKLQSKIDEHGWDGEWYRRAYFDNGVPLGSAQNQECQIDSISQSWAILSGVASADRGAQAMEHLDRRLVRPEARLIQLLDPPFDTSCLNPGYIKGYVPGVRENGGQYTHAAIWTVMAFAKMKNSHRAWDLFGMINPITHADTAEGAEVYRVEPYVVAADVYAVPPHTGRGGWTWYTGSAGWMYRLITESLLGFRLECDKLHFAPTFPANWSTFKIHYRFYETVYHITFSKRGKGAFERIVLDGQVLSTPYLPLINDHTERQVDVESV